MISVSYRGSIYTSHEHLGYRVIVLVVVRIALMGLVGLHLLDLAKLLGVCTLHRFYVGLLRWLWKGFNVAFSRLDRQLYGTLLHLVQRQLDAIKKSSYSIFVTWELLELLYPSWYRIIMLLHDQIESSLVSKLVESCLFPASYGAR